MNAIMVFSTATNTKKSKGRNKYYRLEKILKAAANHRRLETLFLLERESDLSTEAIVMRLGINYQTGAQHVRRLVDGGLVNGHRQGSTILHALTPQGTSILYLLKNIK